MKKKLTSMAFMVATILASSSAHAAVIEHQGDRYIINVDEMNLTGEESLIDILLMCPEAISLDGNCTASQIPFDNFSLRSDNLNIDTDPKTYLTQIKAKEISKIKICTNPGVMKGSAGLNKKIDLYFKKGDNGVTGRVIVDGDSYGSVSTFNTVKYKKDNIVVWGELMGGYGYEGIEDVRYRNTSEYAKAGINWDISDNDNMIIQLSQRYVKEEDRDNYNYAYDHYYNYSMVYTHTMSPNGASFLFQGVADYATDKSGHNYDKNHTTAHSRATSPYILGEFNFPLFSKNLWITAGVETGVSNEQNVLADYYNWFYYCDMYAQLDWNIKGVNISIGDRVRSMNYWQSEYESIMKPTLGYGLSYNHSLWDHFFNASIYGNLSKKSSLKGTFAKTFYTPWFEDFIGRNTIYLTGVKPTEAYISELKYVYQHKNFVLTAILNNAHTQELGDHDNIIQTGVSVYYHTGILYLTAGANYYHDKICYGEARDHNNFVRLRLQPQLQFRGDWRIVPTMLYNSRITYDTFLNQDLSYKPANFTAALEVEKGFGALSVHAKLNNIVDQHHGKRTVCVGFEYDW